MNEVWDESENEANYIEKNDHDIESEQLDISNNETDENVSDDQNNNFYSRKEKNLFVEKTKPNLKNRVRFHNIIAY